MSATQIQKSLDLKFIENRVVFWYDQEKEWTDVIDEIELPEVKVLKVANNEIGVKFRVLKEEKEQKFLLYFEKQKPGLEDNWLLDILLSNGEFHADKASLHAQEAGIPPELQGLVDDHPEFFALKKRRDALAAKVQNNDDSPDSLKRKMMAIVLGAQDHSLDAILLSLCQKLAGAELLHPVEDNLGSFGLVEPFWREVRREYGYAPEKPSLLDFVISVFEFNAPQLSKVSDAMTSQAVVFLSRWKDSDKARKSFMTLSQRTAEDLKVGAKLDQLSDQELKELVKTEVDAFENVEKRLICWARDLIINRKWKAESRREMIEKRSRSVWYPAYAAIYEALNHSGELLDLIETISFDVADLDRAIKQYGELWWNVDFHYRKFHQHRREAIQPGLLASLEEEVERRYLNDFLNPLATRWESLLDQHATWPPANQPKSRSFFKEVVKPRIDQRGKMVVIISDAFRYECGQELARILNALILKKGSFNADVGYRLASLPSYTGLGMASLLPHETLSISENLGGVAADGAGTSGSKAREKQLNVAEGVTATAVSSEEFMAMDSKVAGREMMRDFDVIYVYHNEIDDTGDKLKTERQTAKGCYDGISTVIQMVKRAASINATNIVVTADHGFLFQQSPVGEADCCPAPAKGTIDKTKSRFVIGRGLETDTTIRAFKARDLGLENDFEIGIVKGVQRLKIRGAGKLFVHGGAMPQEVMVPVVSIQKSRTSDIQSVDIEIQRFPTRLTTMSVAVRLFQKQVVSEADKVLGRELIIGLYDPEGGLISNRKKVRFESTDEEPRNREEVVHLTLDNRAVDFPNQQLELRLEEVIPNTQKTRSYDTALTTFVKPSEIEFDDFDA